MTVAQKRCTRDTGLQVCLLGAYAISITLLTVLSTRKQIVQMQTDLAQHDEELSRVTKPIVKVSQHGLPMFLMITRKQKGCRFLVQYSCLCMDMLFLHKRDTDFYG